MEVGDGNPWRSSPKCLQIPSAWRSRVLHVDIAGDMPQSAANLVVAVFLRAPCLQYLHTHRTWVQSFEKRLLDTTCSVIKCNSV